MKYNAVLEKEIQRETDSTELCYRVVVGDHPVRVTQDEIQREADRELRKAGFRIKLTRYEIDPNMFYSTWGCLSKVALVKIWYRYEPA
jgi:hypothetical protein